MLVAAEMYDTTLTAIGYVGVPLEICFASYEKGMVGMDC